MNKRFKSISGLAALVLLVSACDVGTLNASYELTLSKNGLVSGVVESEFTPERAEWYERENNIASALVVNDISYTYNVGSCELEDVVIYVSGSDADSLIDEDISLANLEFANIDYPLSSKGFGLNTGDNNPNVVEVADSNFETACVNPGAYISNSGFITTTKRPNGPVRLDLGLNEWNYEAEVNVAISNIHPADRAYFYALESMCASGDFGTCINPAELGDELLTLLGPESEFTSALSTKWERGAFPTFLADNGFEAYRTEDGGHGVRRYFNNQPLQRVFRNVESSYAALPGWYSTDEDGLVLDIKADYSNWLSDDDKVINPMNEAQIWQQESQAKTKFVQMLKITGLILDSNGTYSKKTKTLKWQLLGYGSNATKTADRPLTTLIPGLVVTFKKDSSKLTSATKKLLKKQKSFLRSVGETRIVGITDSSLDPDRAEANLTLATKRAQAISNYLKNSLKLNFDYVVVTRSSSDSGSSWAKASVNKAVISPYGTTPPLN